MQKTAQAYAKINLYLDIISKKENGYHDIKGIMQKISLCDTVTVTLTPSKNNEIHITCTNKSIPTDEKNIAYKAAHAFLTQLCSDTYKVDIDIEKKIPAAGGLAGGSTDAAATLSLMQSMLGAQTEDIMCLASKLGADVPFCYASGSMITEGIGDILTPIPSLSDCFILIANTGESVSTPEAYAKLDGIYDNFSSSSFDTEKFESLCKALKQNNAAQAAQSMYNIFEQAVLSECTLAAEAKQIMLEYGAVGAMMSGSGPTVFGIFNRSDTAEHAFKKLASLGYSTHICTPIN